MCILTPGGLDAADAAPLGVAHTAFKRLGQIQIVSLVPTDMHCHLVHLSLVRLAAREPEPMCCARMALPVARAVHN